MAAKKAMKKSCELRWFLAVVIWRESLVQKKLQYTASLKTNNVGLGLLKDNKNIILVCDILIFLEIKLFLCYEFIDFNFFSKQLLTTSKKIQNFFSFCNIVLEYGVFEP